MKNKLSLRNLKNDLFMLKYIFRIIPGYFFMTLLLEGVVMGMWNSSYTVFAKLFFDILENDKSFSRAALILGAWALFYLLMQTWYQWYQNVYKACRHQILHYELNKELFTKARTLDMACYDDPEFYNDFVWAMNQSDNQAMALVASIVTVVQHLTALSIVASILMTISPVLAVIAVLCAISTLIIRRLMIKFDLKANLALNPINRKSTYYERIFSTPDYSKELRISHVAEALLEKYKENLDTVKKTQIHYNKKKLIYQLPMGLIYTLMSPVIYIILLYQIMIKKTLGISSLAVSFNAFWNIRWHLDDLINMLIKFPEHGMYIEKVRTFLEYEPKVRSGDIPAPEFDSVTFKNVSFGYNTETQVLKNLDITINRGEKIAIVGYNGAGKSTFIKLLMHLYDPTKGEIIYNGRDIGDYDAKSYQNRIGVVFQDFQIFALPVSENILCDNYSEDKQPTLDYAVKMAAFDDKIAALPKGTDTELTREFYEDGVNLSGGESQKVAIARVFAQPYDLIIMDEPSSALDPMAEYTLNEHIREFAEDKTVIFISHRLSTTRRVDKIYMFENGEIIETGSHDELMAKNGKYSEMFNIQAEKYGA